MRSITVGLVLCLAGSTVALAQGGALRCSAFLHQDDGGWRAFNEGDILGPDGPVHVRAGEVLSPSARSQKGGVARALNDLCAGD